MGRAIAEAFVNEGASVLCADVSGRQEDTASGLGDKAVPLQVDVSSPVDVQRMVATGVELFGRLDILVNNAGILGNVVPFHEQDDAMFERVLAVNLRGVFLGMKYGIRAMLETGGGSIVNMASVGGLVGAMGLSSYAASKGGVVQLTRTAALEYAQRNIRVNAICPGLVWTGMVPGSDGSRVPPEHVPPPVTMPIGRWGLDTEIAATALFLASDEVGYLTGVALPVDGACTAG
jgi:NAD(P)-dependent dehydrogenase (short-subunit alcohol dehydrogenase family)